MLSKELLKKAEPHIAHRMRIRAMYKDKTIYAREMWRQPFEAHVVHPPLQRKYRRQLIGSYVDTPHGLVQIKRVDNAGNKIRFVLQMVDLLEI